MSKPLRLGKRIKKARVLSDMSQEELAKKLGFTNKTVSAYETGRAIPPVPTLQKIAEVTNTTLEYLVNGSDAKKPENKPQSDIIEKKLDLILEELKNISNKL